jgi:hypothetical protein
LLDQRPKDFPKAIDKAGDGAAAIRKEPGDGRNKSSYPGTKTAIDGCPSAGGRDEIHKEYASLAARHSAADHPSDRAFPSSRLIAWPGKNGQLSNCQFIQILRICNEYLHSAFDRRRYLAHVYLR